MKEQGNFNNFEQFLQDQVDDLKMYPSDHVWNNIAQKVQPKKSWPALTFITLFILVTLGTATFLNYPPDNILTKIRLNQQLNKYLPTTNTTKSTSTTASQVRSNASVATTISTVNTTLSNVNNTINSLGATASDNLSNSTTKVVVRDYSSVSSINNKTTITGLAPSTSYANKPLVNTDTKHFVPALIAMVNNHIPTDDAPLINTELKGTTTTTVNKPNPRQAEEAYVANRNIKLTTKSKEWSYEIYATPTASYRRLEDDQVVNQYSSLPSAGSNAINKDVAHKVGLGTEIGIGLRNKVSDNVTFKTGLQFNVRQYYIDAFLSPGLATIEIVKDNKLQSVSVQSKFSNGSGDVKTRLDNKLYQLSVPLGLEWDVISNKKWGLSFGASLQPTYSLNKNVFIISTDYKYYASGASFFRQWNINSSVNANLSFKYNKSTIYVGPQIRYQHLPTYNDQYPIKEYRLDYGIKFGIIKPIK